MNSFRFEKAPALSLTGNTCVANQNIVPPWYRPVDGADTMPATAVPFYDLVGALAKRATAGPMKAMAGV